jgi:hypothetical protein
MQSSTLGNGIEVFGPQAHEGSPKRIIRGSNTGLGGNDGTVPIAASDRLRYADAARFLPRSALLNCVE